MKKILLFSIHTILFLIGLFYSYNRFKDNSYSYETIVYCVIAIFCLLGFIYSLVLMKSFGGRKSLMGKSFLYLGLALLFQAVTIIVDYLFFTFASYSPVSTVLLAFMNVFWAVSMYHFFLITGISEKTRQTWKIVIIAGIIICCSLAAYGSLPLPFADAAFSAAIFAVNGILILESALLLISGSRFRGGTLFWPVLLVCFGIVFQLIGDFLSRGVFQINGLNTVTDDAFYCFSWFLLSMAPTMYLINDDSYDENI